MLVGPPFRVIAGLPSALGAAALLPSGGAVYVVGGEPGGKPVDAVLKVDTATGHVSAAGQFIEPLAEAASAVRAGALYLAGGWTGAKVGTAVLRWTPGTAPVLVARLPEVVRGASAAFLGNRMYVAGGSTRKVYAVDVSAGTVAVTGALPTPAPHSVMVAAAGKLYLLAGRDVLRLAPGTIARVGKLPAALRRGDAIVVAGHLAVVP